MKTFLLMGLLLAASSAAAQTLPATATDALARRLNQLMRRTAEPDTELKALLTDCHITQVIRKYRPAGQNSGTAIQVSHQKNGTNWAVRSDAEVELELKMGVDWREVTALTYERHQDDKTQETYYQLKIRREKPTTSGTNSLTLDLPLYTPDEAVVRDVVQQLEQVRRRCSR